MDQDQAQKARQAIAAGKIPKPIKKKTSAGTSANDTSEEELNRASEDIVVEKLVDGQPKKCFKKFFVKEHVKLAPHIVQLSDPEYLVRVEANTKALDTTLSAPSVTRVQSLQEQLAEYNLPRARGFEVVPVRDLIANVQNAYSHSMQSTAIGPVDLTAEIKEKVQSIVSKKYLEFESDVRPRFCGTRTKRLSPEHSRKLARNPFLRGVPKVEYDYDSEADWEAPEDGELLESDEEGEDLEDADGDDGLDEFIDDEGDASGAKRKITKDLEPICSGLHWENASGNLECADGGEAEDFSQYEIQFLLCKYLL